MSKKPKIQSKLSTNEKNQEIPSGKFWTTRIGSGAPTVLGENIVPGTMVVKNHGPGTIVVDTGYSYENVQLLPGRVRVIRTNMKVEAMALDENSALLEFEYMPKFRLK